MKVWGGCSAGRKAAGLEPPTLVKRLPLTALAGEPPVSSLVQAGPVVELKVNGSRDIDAGEDDPQLASSYVTDIHQHLLSMEVRRRVRVLSLIQSHTLSRLRQHTAQISCPFQLHVTSGRYYRAHAYDTH